MAEDNDSNHGVSEKENSGKEKNHDLKNENDVELIDLSNDEERSVEDGEIEKKQQEVQNGDGHNAAAAVKKKKDKDGDNETINELPAKAASNSNGEEIVLSDDDDEDAAEVSERDGGDVSINGDDAKSENSIASANRKSASSSNNNNNSATNDKQNDAAKMDETITIDDDDDDDDVCEDDTNDVVQDLSTTKPSIDDLIPKLTDQITGFPEYLKQVVTLGECIAINKRSKSDIDLDKDCSILDCPSQVVPLIIKKANKFPAKLKQEKEDAAKAMANHAPAPSQSTNNKNMLTISDFYSSSIGKFLMGIGLSRVKQWYHKDAIYKVRKQIRKEGEAEDLMEELKKQQDYLNTCRGANASYLFAMEKCEHCEYRTEFKSVMSQHMLYPHMTTRKEFKCNYCQFSTRDSKVIIGHVNMLHEKQCLIELPPQLYECPICPYESGVKSKAATHIAKCLKFFVADKLLVNKDDYFPTITPKPITQEDIKIYEATLQALRFAALNPQNKVPQIPGLPVGLQQQMYSIQQQHQGPRSGPGRPAKLPPASAGIVGLGGNNNHAPHHNSGGGGGGGNNIGNINSNKLPRLNPFLLNQMNIKNLSPQLYQMLSAAPHGQFLQNPAAVAGNLGHPQTALNFMNKHQQMLKMSSNSGSARDRNSPSSINLQQSANHHANNANNSMLNSSGGGGSSSSANNILAGGGNKPNVVTKQNSSGMAGNRGSSNPAAPGQGAGAAGADGNSKGSFVMCEICDGYIKDLEQLRTHMHWIHKVRIHPKMLANRPPLNCQKCQWRFFTDQGLERHLLGAHGLVTSNMQDMVNQNQDGGRCTICGRVFNNKLVTHMNQTHKINLKPAHLSYKCTVCSATFNLYRLFENHVYMVHSGSVKRNSDDSSGQPPRKKAAMDSMIANSAANGN